MAAFFHETQEYVLGKFRGYLEEDYSHLRKFADFLAGSEYGSVRETIRPFTIHLADEDRRSRRNNSEGLLDGVKRDLIERMKEDLPEDTLNRFILSVWDDSEVGQWLRFTFMLPGRSTDGMPDSENASLQIARDIKGIPMSSWPKSLRDGFSVFAINEVAGPVTDIRKSLEQFHNPILPVPTEVRPFARTNGLSKKRHHH